MSYCNRLEDVGVNLTLGFHPEVIARIRSKIAAAPCSCTNHCFAIKYYRDDDQDGYGNPDTMVSQCGDAPDGYVTDDTDCDDNDATVGPP